MPTRFRMAFTMGGRTGVVPARSESARSSSAGNSSRSDRHISE
jgi:hypothetical protein